MTHDSKPSWHFEFALTTLATKDHGVRATLTRFSLFAIGPGMPAGLSPDRR